MLDKKYILIRSFVKPATRFPYHYYPCHINGYPTERRIKDYHYSYTAHTLYHNGWKPTDQVVYSDRLRMWYDDYFNLKRKYLGTGGYWSSYEPEKIESFLSILFSRKITLTGIEEECNCSNGYPYWVLYYREDNPGGRIETDKYTVYIHHNTDYTVVITDKKTRKPIFKTYKYRGWISKYLDKYGIAVDLKEVNYG